MMMKGQTSPRRLATNVLLVVTLGLLALNRVVLGARPTNDPELVTRWASRVMVYIGIIVFLVALIALLAVREARSILEQSRDERRRMLTDLIGDLHKQKSSDTHEYR